MTSSLPPLEEPGNRRSEGDRLGGDGGEDREVLCTVVAHEAHKRQVEEKIQTLHEGPEGFYEWRFPASAHSPLRRLAVSLGHSASWDVSVLFEELSGKMWDALKHAVPNTKVVWSKLSQFPVTSRSNTS
jgi:hypothetical protein